MNEQRDILLIVDGLARDITLEGTWVILMSKTEGFHELAMKLKQQDFTVRLYKVIILLIGRGNVWDTDKRFFAGVEAVIDILKNQNEFVLIMLGVSLPSPGDSRPMINSFGFRNDKIAGRCGVEARLEHVRPGKHLLGPRGPIPDYFDDYSNINELGGDVITRALERKIFSAKLFSKYDELRSGEV